MIKKTGKFILTVISIFLLYVVLSIAHGTFTDYRPQGISQLNIENSNNKEVLQDSVFTLLTWNIGYGGLGADCDFFYSGAGFFYSGDKMIRPPKTLVDQNVSGILHLIQEHPADFYLFQEVDFQSKRSYCFNQYEAIKQTLGNLPSTFSPNFRVERIPIPVFQPWSVYGAAESGLATFSKIAPQQVNRHQLPGEFGWPDRIFQLDRCAAVSRYPHVSGKELVVLNIHNSAYDKGGKLKKQQMAYLREFFMSEYEKGNFVIAGGDWNQAPPTFPFFSFRPDYKGPYPTHLNIPVDLMPEDWTWIYDPTVPTSRSTKTKYFKQKSFVQLIDFYLISPNLEATMVKAVDHDFAHSDHQPVKLEIKIKN